LISLLKTIAYGWRQETVAANARAISDLGRELFERLNSMANHMNRLGRDIEHCATTYNQVIGSLERRVLASGRKFLEFGISLEGDRDLVQIDPVETATRKAQTDLST
jgi:DNA recombination protein RmuC